MNMYISHPDELVWDSVQADVGAWVGMNGELKCACAYLYIYVDTFSCSSSYHVHIYYE